MDRFQRGWFPLPTSNPNQTENGRPANPSPPTNPSTPGPDDPVQQQQRRTTEQLLAELIEMQNVQQMAQRANQPRPANPPQGPEVPLFNLNGPHPMLIGWAPCEYLNMQRTHQPMAPMTPMTLPQPAPLPLNQSCGCLQMTAPAPIPPPPYDEEEIEELEDEEYDEEEEIEEDTEEYRRRRSLTAACNQLVRDNVRLKGENKALKEMNEKKEKLVNELSEMLEALEIELAEKTLNVKILEAELKTIKERYEKRMSGQGSSSGQLMTDGMETDQQQSPIDVPEEEDCSMCQDEQPSCSTQNQLGSKIKKFTITKIDESED